MRKIAAIIIVILVILLAIALTSASLKPVTPAVPQNTDTPSNTPPAQTPPPIVTPTGTTTLVLNINESGKVGMLSITPREVVEDSRCPASVQCIQAGTVRVKTELSTSSGTSSPIFTLNQTILTGAESITFVSVTPAKQTPGTIATSTYEFTFLVSKR